MKTWKTIALVAVVATTLMSCASNVYVERDATVDLAQYKTYRWVDTKRDQHDNSTVTAFGQEAIRRAVQAELAKRGLQEDTTNPDLLVTHDVLVERTTTEQRDPVYSQPFTRVYYNPFLRRWATIYYPSRLMGYDAYSVPVREGTLTITLLDTETDRTVWQGWTTEQLDSRKFTQADMEKTAQRILKRLKL